MSSDYTPRHGAPRRSRRLPSGSVRRPLVGVGVSLALVTSVGAAVGQDSSFAAPSEQASSGRLAPAGDAVTALTSRTAEDAARVADARRVGTASRSQAREQERLEAARKKAAEKKAAEQRKKAAEQRKRKAAQERLQAVQADPKPVAQEIMREYGFGDDQWSCLAYLWTGESDWRWDATNPSSGAYGIPQSLPASKMASAGADWKTNPETQIRWGLDYIKQSYGSPCGAMNFWNSQNPHWY